MPVIIFNNQEFNIVFSPVDTPDAKLNKIAYTIRALPKNVHMDSSIDADRIRVQDIARVARTVEDPIDYIKRLQPDADIYSGYADRKIIDVLGYWLTKPVGVRSAMFEFISVPIEPVFATLGGNLNEYTEEKYSEELKLFLTQQKKKIELQGNLERLADYSSVSSFVLTQQTMSQKFTIGGMRPGMGALNSIFNSLHVDRQQVHFITFNSYYKLIKNFIPPNNWITSGEYISLRIMRNGDYIEYQIGLVDDESFSLMYDNPVFVNDVLAYIQSQYKLTVGDKTLSNQKGYISIPGLINMDVIGDILLCIQPFSSHFAYSDNLTRKKRPVSRTMYFMGSGPIIVSSIENRIATKNDIYPSQTAYTMITITQSANTDDLELFQYMMRKLLTLHDLQQKEIIADYKRYGINIGVIETPQASFGKKYAKEKAPEIMGAGSGYSRVCPKARIPTILDDDDKEAIYEAEANGRLFLFPVNHPTVKSYKLACLNDTYPYMGLVKNPAAPLGYQPCSTKKPNKAYADYLNGKLKLKGDETEVDNTGGATSAISLKTSKIIRFGNIFGKFPISHNNIPSTIQFTNNPFNTIMRQGSDEFPSSFLECVLIALGVELPDSETDRIGFVNKARAQLLNDGNIVYLKQEMYEYSDEDIMDYINDPKRYLDPKLTAKLLERVFECNITLFEDNSMVLPRHKAGYYEFQRHLNLPAIYIYINKGAESDKLLYPHCELIVNVDVDGGTKPFTADTIEFVNGIRVKLSSFYNGGKAYIEFPDEDEFTSGTGATAQVFDYNGKVRMILVGDVWIHTSPLPPMLLETVDNTIDGITATSDETATRILRQFSSERIMSNKLFLYTFNSYFNLKINVSSESHYTTFINNNKVARYLTNWFKYLFSQYVYETNADLSDITKPIQAFVQSRIDIDGGFKYDTGNISEYFRMDNAQGMFRAGKLVVHTTDLLQRLIIQVLIEHQQRGNQGITDFRTKTTMDSYFINIYDFSYYANEILIKTTAPIKDYLTSYSIVLHDTPVNETEYIFANRNIIDKAYAAKSDISLDSFDLENITDCNLFIFHDKYNVDHYIVWDKEGYSLFDPAYYQDGDLEPPAFESIPILMASRQDTSQLLYTQLTTL